MMIGNNFSLKKQFHSREYWQRFGWGILVGFLGAIGALIFIVLVNHGLKWLWPEPASYEPFSGSWRIAAIMTAAGFVVGLIHHFAEAEEIDVFAALLKGRLDPKPVPGALLVALVSLIGGFSLGPEVPTGMLAGRIAVWFSDRWKLPDETRRTNILSAVMGAYGGLFTSPFTAVMMLLELTHAQSPAYFGTLLIGALAALGGFAVFFIASGYVFADTLRLWDLPLYDLRIWHLGAAALMSILGTALAVTFGLTVKAFRRLIAPLERRPLIRSTLGGLLLGLLAMALPLTQFLGTEGLVTVTENAAQIGVGLLIVLALAKMVALAGALSTGFIGGPIFPLLFVGGTIGTALHLAFPAAPLALTTGCMMASISAALLPVPLSMGVLVLLIVGTPPTEMVPVFLVALLSYVFMRGLGLVGEA